MCLAQGTRTHVRLGDVLPQIAGFC